MKTRSFPLISAVARSLPQVLQLTSGILLVLPLSLLADGSATPAAAIGAAAPVGQCTGRPLRGIELAGAAGRFHPAAAEISGQTVVARAEPIHAPRQVRFFRWSGCGTS